VAYSAEQVLLNKPQIYGGPAKLHCYLNIYLPEVSQHPSCVKMKSSYKALLRLLVRPTDGDVCHCKRGQYILSLALGLYRNCLITQHRHNTHRAIRQQIDSWSVKLRTGQLAD